MSLKLGKAFITALRSSTELQVLLGATQSGSTYTGARIFAVARDDKAEKEDAIPYLVMMPNGITTDGSEDDYEQTDVATIDLLCVAATYSLLVDLTSLVRSTIEENLAGTQEFQVNGYTFSASSVQYDPDKPCYFQTLSYQVNTQA